MQVLADNVATMSLPNLQLNLKPNTDTRLDQISEQAFDDYANLATTAISNTQNLADLQALKVTLTGKKSELSDLSKQMGGLSADDKKRFGAYLSTLKNRLQTAFDTQNIFLQDQELQATLQKQAIDISLPARGQVLGNLHPITQTANRMQDFFCQAGFKVASGPEIESDYYNFEALNIPSHHPARAMHDTFYFDANYLLRTHTSSVQIRTMQEGDLPIRIICPGRVYRCDSDQTHSPMFHQLEGLYIGKSTNFAELKGLIHEFLQVFFGKKLSVRFRPSYFPFTEPSAEVDILADNGKWLEVMGCGMVHPKVLTNCGIDPDQYQGFAFGMGIERFAMLYYGINDLRLFYQNDVRFLRQFG